MKDTDLSQKHELEINSSENTSPLKTLPYGDSVVFPDSGRYFLAVGIGDRTVVRELVEHPVDWDTRTLLGMTAAATERLRKAQDSIWRHRAQINTLLDLRVYSPMYRGLNSSIVPILEVALKDVSYKEIRQFIKIQLTKLLMEQVKDGGPTHFVDISQLESSPDIAVLVPQVIELRRNEIEEVTLVEKDGVIDLRPLIMTAWGFELVNVLGLGLETDGEGCDSIQRRLYELNLEVEISDTTSYSSTSQKMSCGLKEYILSLVT